jgi:plastocyanin
MADSRTWTLLAIVAIIVVIVATVAFMMGGDRTNNPPASGKEVQIVSSGYSFGFSPSSLAIHVGENVTWVNHAGADHDVVSDNLTDPFDSGIMANGQSFTHRFDQMGVFPYHCSIHTFMTGTITVVA